MNIDPTFLESLNFVVRWAHLITGIAWIGSSFFFVWLDNHLEHAPDLGDDVEGRLWMTHSGGFYDVVKFKTTMAKIPDNLHWFKWEAAWTAITGVFLLIIVFYLGADGFLIKQGSDMSKPLAAAIGLGALVGSWLVYDFVWRQPIVEKNDLLFSALTFAALVALAWFFNQIFTAKAAYIHTGAVIGLVMVLNVWVIILPGQSRMIKALKAGEAPDPNFALRAKLRSMHNSYVTLPVIAIMLSGHYPMFTGHPQNWLVLAVLMVLGAAVRHWFIARHKGNASPIIPVAVAIAALGLFYYLMPRAVTLPPGTEVVAFEDVQTIINRNCISCHDRNPANEDFDAPPKGISFDNPAAIKTYAAKILAQAVNSDTMPLGNESGMTADERKTLGIWIAQGANLDAE